MQTDPVGYADQMNLYAYVGNDPVNAVDPSGEILKIGKALFNVGKRALKNGGDFKKALKDEALSAVDNLATLADGDLFPRSCTARLAVEGPSSVPTARALFNGLLSFLSALRPG